MNNFFKQMNVFVLCALVATTIPTYSMENDIEVENDDIEVVIDKQEVEQKPVTVWYKKSSVQFVAAVTAVAIYAYAVHIGKISAPAFLAALVAAKVVQTNVAPQSEQLQPDNQLNQDESTIIVEENAAEQKVNQSVTSSAKLVVNNLEEFARRCLQTAGRTPEQMQEIGE